MDRPGALGAIGNTPVVRLERLVEPGMAEVWVKLEAANPTGSYKDRMALAMIEGAERAAACSRARRSSSTPAAAPARRWPSCARSRATRCASCPRTRSPREDPHDAGVRRGGRAHPSPEGITPDAHPARCASGPPRSPPRPARSRPTSSTTPTWSRATAASARSCWSSSPGRIDAVVHLRRDGGLLPGRDPGAAASAARGCTGSRWSRPSRRSCRGAGGHPPHRGRRRRLLPAAPVARRIDEVIAVSSADAFAMARRAAREDGVWSGPSTGANISAALAVARRLGPGTRVATIQVDSGLKYLSGPLYA